MGKKKTSVEPKGKRKSSFEIHSPYANPDLTDKRIVRAILIEALAEGDLDTFQDVLVGYLRTSSKLGLSRNCGIGRTTLYDLMNPEKPFNPTLETIGKIFEDLAA
ncbi:MAG: hypothetical protein EBX52_07220 [Proteobacteria bacterium]|nr:hypothetical protein [Pseudomonadota bacterium]